MALYQIPLVLSHEILYGILYQILFRININNFNNISILDVK